MEYGKASCEEDRHEETGHEQDVRGLSETRNRKHEHEASRVMDSKTS